MRTKASLCVATANARWNARLASCAAAGVVRRRSVSMKTELHRVEVDRASAASAASRATAGSSSRRASSRSQHAVETEVGDEEAAVDLELDQAVAGQPPQRLPHRASRDAQLLGELRLTETRARAASAPPTICARISS